MSKHDFTRLKEISKLGREAAKQLEPQIQNFEETIAIVLKNAPTEQKGEIEKLQATISKSFALAKQGKALDATELIKNFKNGRKDFKKGV